MVSSKSEFPQQDSTQPINKTPFWNIQLGKLNNGEWASELVFTNINDTQWLEVCEYIKKYTKIQLRTCPPAFVSTSSRKIQFRLGLAQSKPELPLQTGTITQSEIEVLRNSLLNNGKTFHEHGLGFWSFDSRLLWKIDDTFLFVPTFWLPTIAKANCDLPCVAPEYKNNCIPTQPSETTDIYAVATLCFQALTGQAYDHKKMLLPGEIHKNLQAWDVVLDPALRENPARRIQTFSNWRKTQPHVIPVTPFKPTTTSSHPTEMDTTSQTEIKPTPTLPLYLMKRRKWLITAFALLLTIIGLARVMIPNLLRRVPFLGMFAPSYQRGTGSYVVRYADRSYNNAKWEMVWSTENLGGKGRLYHISGWDKNNFSIICGYNYGCMLSLKEGHWIVQNDSTDGVSLLGIDVIHYMGSDLFVRVMPGTLASIIRVYEQSASSQFLPDGFYDAHIMTVFQPETDLVYVTGQHKRKVGGPAYEYKNKEFTEIRRDEKKCFVWEMNNTNTGKDISNIRVVHGFKRNQALGYCDGDVVLYKDGIWYKLHETQHTGTNIDIYYNGTEDIGRLWAIDENNFILTGPRKITIFRDGIESHPFVDVSGWASKQGGLTAWGIDMNKFWLLVRQRNEIISNYYIITI